MIKILRIYIFDGYRDTVIESQVFNWASALKASGLITRGLCLINKRNINIEKQNKLVAIAKKYDIEVDVRYFINKPLIREIMNLLSLIVCYHRQKKNYDKIVFQTRMLGLIYVLPLCRALTGTKFIMDFRGSPLIEFLYQNKQYPIRKRLTLENLERMVCHNSDAVFCVSNVLRNYLADSYSLCTKDINKISVIPGAADSKYFFYSEELRNNKRSELACHGKKVYIYTGRLDKQWQIPDKIFALFKRINSKEINSFFIVLTPDIDIARSCFQKIQVSSDKYVVEYVSMDSINPYLNAADYAIALRENLPINNQASPTKIAEYLLTGLLVVISKGIGDFSEFIRENNLGFELDLDNENASDELITSMANSYLSEDFEKHRNMRADFSKKFYAKEVYLDKIKDKCLEL
jgi:hypothetical protein